MKEFISREEYEKLGRAHKQSIDSVGLKMLIIDTLRRLKLMNRQIWFKYADKLDEDYDVACEKWRKIKEAYREQQKLTDPK